MKGPSLSDVDRPRVRFVVVALVAVAFVGGSALVAAQSGTSAEFTQTSYSDDFEDGDLDEYTTVSSSGSSNVVNGSVLGGGENWQLEMSSGTGTQREQQIASDQNVTLGSFEFQVEFDFAIDDDGGMQSDIFGLYNSGQSSDRYANEWVQVRYDYADGLEVRTDIDGSRADMTLASPGEVPGGSDTDGAPGTTPLHMNLTVDWEEGTVSATVTNESGQTWSNSRSISAEPAGWDGWWARYHINVNSDQDPSSTYWIDNVTATGVTAGDLSLDARPFMHHDTTQSYTVEFNDSGTVSDVTGNATVTSSNTTVLTVNESLEQLNATADESVNRRVTVTAEYQGRTAQTNVTVANATVDNLDILPIWWKVSATLSDWTVIWIIVATAGSIVAVRMSTTFGGIGAFVAVLTMGWFIGEVPTGIVTVAFLAAVFLGLNLGNNVDYSVRRG